MVRWLVPAIFVTLCCATQSRCQSSPPTTSPAAGSEPAQAHPAANPDPSAKSSAPKKVWTNENLAEVSGTISVVGDKRNQKYTMTPDKPADPATVSRIRQELQKLQAQLDEVTRKLAAFKDFQSGETVTAGDQENAMGYARTPVNQQAGALDEKKKKLQAQIDALVDEARKKGIEPGQLR